MNKIKFDPFFSFIKLVNFGEFQLRDIDDFISKWHDGNYDCTLAEFLGMTDTEYAYFVEAPYSLPFIIMCHKHGLNTEEYLGKLIQIPSFQKSNK